MIPFPDMFIRSLDGLHGMVTAMLDPANPSKPRTPTTTAKPFPFAQRQPHQPRDTTGDDSLTLAADQARTKLAQVLDRLTAQAKDGRKMDAGQLYSGAVEAHDLLNAALTGQADQHPTRSAQPATSAADDANYRRLFGN